MIQVLLIVHPLKPVLFIVNYSLSSFTTLKNRNQRKKIDLKRLIIPLTRNRMGRLEVLYLFVHMVDKRH